MHSHDLITSKGHKRSLAKETKEAKGTKEDSFNNEDQDSVKDLLKHNTTPPMHLAG